MAHGFPTTRDEDWKFTNIAPISGTVFDRAPEDTPEPTREQLAPYLFDGAIQAQVVFVNGRYSRALSSVAGLPTGVEVTSLRDDLTHGRDHTPIGKLGEGHHAFVALNTAFFEDGVCIRAARKVTVKTPIHVLFVSTSSAAPTMASPRVLALIGEGAQVTIVESYASLGSGVTLTNAVSEYVLGDAAIVEHYKVQREQSTAFHVSSTFVSCGRSSTFTSQSISLGGRIVRNDIVSVLAGDGAECTLNGLYVADGDSLVDNHTTIDHAQPHCPSHEVYKGILAGRAKAVFNGKIIVRPDAQKTDAKQTNKALLLSDEATINTKPQLEIFADDVKCTHGAAIGQMDEDALFYLRARGIPESEARRLLLHAFLEDAIAEIVDAGLRDTVRGAVNAALEGVA
jgi:Fe-S cluster assembly protein SufD